MRPASVSFNVWAPKARAVLSRLIQNTDEAPLWETTCGKTWIIISGEIAADKYTNIFTDEKIDVIKQSGELVLNLSAAFSCFPVAMLSATVSQFLSALICAMKLISLR